MFADRKINTIASVVTAMMTFIGVAATLVYYLSLDARRDWFGKFITIIAFTVLVIFTMEYTKKRLEDET